MKVTPAMIGAAHDVTMKEAGIILSHDLISKIYEAMSALAEQPEVKPNRELLDERDALAAEAERLAMALRLAEEYINDLTPEWYSAGQRVLAEIRAVLSEGNSND